MNVFEKVVAVIAEHTSTDVSEFKEYTTFESLGVDSLDIVEMVMKFEDEFGTELELEEQFNTVGELAKFIESKLGL